MALASGGLAAATLDTSNTFLTGDRPPGKSAHMPRRFPVGRVRVFLGTIHEVLGATCIATVAAVLPVPALRANGGLAARTGTLTHDARPDSMVDV